MKKQSIANTVRYSFRKSTCGVYYVTKGIMNGKGIKNLAEFL